MLVTWRWPSIACVACCFGLFCLPQQARADARDALMRRLIQLEAEAHAVLETLRGDSPKRSNRLPGKKHPRAARLRRAVRQGALARWPALALVEQGRLAESVGEYRQALAHYARASRRGREAHVVAAAVERFTKAAGKVARIPRLPDVQGYIERIGRGERLDVAGYETLYALGRRLLRTHDPRAQQILRLIPADSSAGRRALYLRGAHILRARRASGDAAQQASALQQARRLFRRAAKLPLPTDPGVDVAREREARALSWLAVGRLAFEAGAIEEGFYAYHQIPIDSPHFSQAYYELGWLALEAGYEQAAATAFEALGDFAPKNTTSSRARLMKGYVLLQKGRFADARSYYETLARDLQAQLRTLDAAFAQVDSPARLAQECTARREASQHPQLQRVLAHPLVERGVALGAALETYAALGSRLEGLRAKLDAVLQGQGDANPFAQLARDKKRVQGLLLRTQDLALAWSKLEGRGRWQSSRTPTPLIAKAEQTCCDKPQLRLQAVRRELEAMAQELGEREQNLRHQLQSLRKQLLAHKREHASEVRRMRAAVQSRQGELVERAMHAIREDIRHTMMEGEAGVLEAVWRVKEQHLERMQALDARRRRALEQLRRDFAKVLNEGKGD